MCDFCKMDNDVYGNNPTSVKRIKHFYIEDYGDHNVISHDAYEASEEFEINYCPMCGRKLNEEK